MGDRMETVIVLAAIGYGVYAFFRANTARGVRTVRAHVFLSILRRGGTVAEANQYAGYDVANGPTEVINAAMSSVKANYGGKQKPMIAEARRMGMLQSL
jgi:hypothetical protein